MTSQEQPLVISTQKELKPYAPPVDVIEPKEIIENLWHRKLKILSIVAMLMLLTVIVLSIITPRYTAETLVMVDSRRGNIINFDPVLPSLSIDNETIASEIEILKSQDFAGKVVNHLNLYADPEFNVALRPKSRLAEALRTEKFIPDVLLNILDENYNGVSEGKGESIEKALTVAAFMEGMSVSRKGDARIIKISYSSISAKKATEITNAIADVYISEQLTVRLEATRNATSWLTERVAPLQDKVRQSAAAITQFKRDSGLTESRGTTLNSQQMAELSSQLIIAQTDYAEAQARMRHVNRLIKRSGAVDSTPEVLESKLIQALRVQEAELQGKMGELSTEFGERHPTMIQLRAELKDLRTKINLEVTKIVNGIRNEAEIARVRKATLQNNLNKLKDLDAKNNNVRVELQALEREAEADRKLLEVLLSRLKEAASQNDIDNFQPDARVVSYGSIPINPSYPKKAPILVLMLFGSVLIAILLLSLSGPSNQVFRSCEEIEMQTELPSLGFLPNIRQRWPEKIVVKKPESAFAESVRTLYSSALLAFAGSKIKTLLITSTESGEGNTTIATCLAKTRAIAGDKTLIVDLNLRDPNIHSIFGIEKSPGITELLSGNCPLEEVIRTDPETGAHIITVGAACLNPADILMGNNMEVLILILHDLYDLVIIDSPPIMAVPDARLLLDKVDATLFVVRWAQTKRKFVQKALAEAAASRNQLIGVVLNMVDEKKYPQYAYKSSGYYYSRSTRAPIG